MHSSISGMHLMPSASSTPALLTASLRYGVVARSYPLTGKILRGYLDATGTLNGLGNGNPNAEFSPDVTRCVMSADGGTARVIWGFRTGAVAVTTAHKAMEAARAVGARWVRCSAVDAHEGGVEDAAWASEGGNAPSFFVTGGGDGRVKLWDAKRVVCLWTSKQKVGQVVKDPCVKVAVDATSGAVAAALKSGECVLWTGFAPLFVSESGKTIQDCSIQETFIPPPPVPTTAGPYADSARSIASFYLYSDSPQKISLLTAYENETRLRRCIIALPAWSMDQIFYGDESTGYITALKPVFASKPGEHSFLLVGDQLGSVSIFPWNGVPVPSSPSQAPSSPTIRSIPASRKFQAHETGAITAIVWTPTVIVTGSSKGTLRAFDSLTLSPLRSFAYSSLRVSPDDEVKDIVVDRDFFAASVGNRVVAWRGEAQGKQEKTWKGKRSASKAATAVAKWHREYKFTILVSGMRLMTRISAEQYEISREITESRRELEYEQSHTRRVYTREREQNSTLEHLGLSEVEAVEYVLMLSRDQEEQRRLAELQAEHEEVLLGEFDEDVRTPMTHRPSFFDTPPPSVTPPRYGLTPSAPYTPSSGSSSKIQISPRTRPEPMEAGFAASSPLSLSSSLSSSRGVSRTPSHAPSPHDADHFPSMGSTPTRASVASSPQSVRSAWSTPLRSARSSEGPSSPRVGPTSVASSPVAPRSPGVSLLSAKFAAALTEAEEDADLRFALELSLAEARSRGEEV